ncbi:MAG: hypothetical protein AAFQ94_19755, partial [Bacteroidota bacterium]
SHSSSTFIPALSSAEINGDDPVLQKDLKLYVDNILGLDESNPGRFYNTRKKGDIYSLIINPDFGAKVTYQPSENNNSGVSGFFYMNSSKFLRQMISTFISYENCSEELRDELPFGLNKYFLKAIRITEDE